MTYPLYEHLPFPPNVIHRIGDYLDIDTRRTLGFEPRRLTASHYTPLQTLVFPDHSYAQWAILRLKPLRDLVCIQNIPYLYQRIRWFSRDGVDFYCDTVFHLEYTMSATRYDSRDLEVWNHRDS